MFYANMQILSYNVSEYSPSIVLSKNMQTRKFDNSFNTAIKYTPIKNSPPAAYFHPAFCGGNKIEAFSSLIDAISLGQIKPSEACTEIKKTLPDILRQIGAKTNEDIKAQVFRLDDKYEIKLKSKGQLSYEKIDILPNIKLKTWYGYPLVEVDNGKVAILKNVNPNGDFTGAGISDKSILYLNEKAYNEKVNKLANVQQKAFNRVAKDMKLLNNQELKYFNAKYLSIDFNNPNNFMFSGNEIRIINGISRVCKQDKNNVFALTRALMGRYLTNVQTNYSQELVKPRQQILKKCFIANEKAQLPIEEPPHSEFEVNHILNICGIKKGWPEMKANISKIRETYDNVDNRATAVGKYFDELFKENI